MQIVLPNCGWRVQIKENILWAEYKAIENFYQNNTKAQIVDGKPVPEIDGNVVEKREKLLIQTFLQECRGKNNEEISTVGLMDRLDVEDGMFLEKNVLKVFEDIKKKLGKIQ